MTNMPNAPLIYAVTVVRFPPLPEPERFIPAFHEAIRSNYPLRDEVTIHNLNAMMGSEGLSIQKGEAKLWQFAAIDNSFAFFLGADCLGLHTACYLDHQDFADRLETGLTALLRTPDIGIQWVISIGLRYIDLVVPRLGEVLEDYLKPHALPGLPNEIVGEGILQEAVSVTSWKAQGSEFRLQFLRNPPFTMPFDLETPLVVRNGWKRPKPTSDFIIMDIDHGLRFGEPPEPIAATALATRLKQLRGLTRELFRAVTTDFAMAVWDNKA